MEMPKRWGETTCISALTTRRSQSATLIERQHCELQQRLLHNTDINLRQCWEKGTFLPCDTSHPTSRSATLVTSTRSSRNDTFSVHHCLFCLISPTHLQFFGSIWMCYIAANSSLHFFLSSLFAFSLLSLHPEELGHALLKLLCSVTSSFTSSTLLNL